MNYFIHSGPYFILGWVFPLWRNSQWRRCEPSPDWHQYRLHGVWVCDSGVDNVWSCAERPPLSSPDHWNYIRRSSFRGPQCLSVLQRLENLHFWLDCCRMVQVHGLHHWGNGHLINLFGGKMKLDIEVGCRLIAIVGTFDGSYFTELVSVPPGEWHLVVLSWLPTEGLRLFINGCLVSAVSDVNNPATVAAPFAVKINIANILDEDYLFDKFYIWFRQQTNEFIMKHYHSYHEW